MSKMTKKGPRPSKYLLLTYLSHLQWAVRKLRMLCKVRTQTRLNHSYTRDFFRPPHGPRPTRPQTIKSPEAVPVTNWAEKANPHIHDRFVQGGKAPGPWHLQGWVGSKVSNPESSGPKT